MLEQISPPEFIHPKSIRELTTEQFDAHIARIREERLKVQRVYAQREADKQAAADEKARRQLDKQYEMLGKELARVDKALESMSDRYVKIQALRLQLGIDL